MTARIRIHALVAVLGLAMAACSREPDASPEASQVGAPATISHVHGLGVDSSGTLHVATHYGLIKAGANGGWVYASADRNDHMGFSLHPEGIMYRSGHSPSKPSLGVESSTDGARWAHLSDVADPPVDFHSMAVSFADSKTLWGWDSGGRGSFRSADGGKSWTPLAAKGIERQIYVFAGPAQPNVVLAGTTTGLYRSVDGGATWKPVAGTGGGFVIAVAADPKNAKRIMAFTAKGMKRTADGGATWAPAGTGLPSGAEITSLAISPADPKTAYAADSSTVYKTTDGGAGWTPLS